MKDYPLPALTLGLDQLSLEGSLPKGAVRTARNIQILADGGFQMRPGFTALISLQGAHSFWRSPAQTRVLCAAQATLFDVDLDAGTAAPLFVGLPIEQPVAYDDVGPDVYFASRGLLRKIGADGTVRTPGIVDLLGTAPRLDAIGGGLFAGRYGVAFSLLNDLGEESGVSSIAWIDLPAGGGITVSAITAHAEAVKVALYITTANGGELYHHATRAWASLQTITDQTIGRLASRQYKQPMRGGTLLRHFNGRLYSVDGKWVSVSDPLDYGVMDAKSGWMSFQRTINVFEPVVEGIFVGLRESTLYLRGREPADFTQVSASKHGAVFGTGLRAKADLFAAELAPARDLPVAVWLSDAGLAIGRPDGSIVYPQASRVALAAERGCALVTRQNGIAQAIFTAENLVSGVGAPTDLTL